MPEESPTSPGQPTPINVPTPNGNVVANKTTVDSIPQKFAVVEGEELKRLQALGAQAQDFMAAYRPETQAPRLEDYDHAFRAWQLSETKRYSSQQVVDLLGGYLGNKCVVDLDMEWVTVTDEYGTDYGVRGKNVEVVAFPFSTVLKRIEDGEYDFLHGVYHTIKHMLESGEYRKR